MGWGGVLRVEATRVSKVRVGGGGHDRSRGGNSSRVDLGWLRSVADPGF